MVSPIAPILSSNTYTILIVIRILYVDIRIQNFKNTQKQQVTPVILIELTKDTDEVKIPRKIFENNSVLQFTYEHKINKRTPF